MLLHMRQAPPIMMVHGAYPKMAVAFTPTQPPPSAACGFGAEAYGAAAQPPLPAVPLPAVVTLPTLYPMHGGCAAAAPMHAAAAAKASRWQLHRAEAAAIPVARDSDCVARVVDGTQRVGRGRRVVELDGGRAVAVAVAAAAAAAACRDTRPSERAERNVDRGLLQPATRGGQIAPQSLLGVIPGLSTAAFAARRAQLMTMRHATPPRGGAQLLQWS